MMPRVASRASFGAGARRFKRRARRLRLWPARALRRRWLRRLKRAPLALRVGLGVALAAILALSLNALYQVVRKPTELFFPVSGTLYKTPQETWREYGPLFRRYATRSIPPQLLAALAQVEGSGNPLVRTYWRWTWVLRPLELYRPASAAVVHLCGAGAGAAYARQGLHFGEGQRCGDHDPRAYLRRVDAMEEVFAQRAAAEEASAALAQ